MMLSAEQLAVIVRRAVGESARVIEHRLVPYSETKVGHLGEHWALEVKYKKSDKSSEENLRLFVKSLTVPSDRHAGFIRERKLFQQEGAFLTKLLPMLLEACPNCEPFAPRCWLATDELLVLEDLRTKGYGMLEDGARQLSGEPLRSALRAQARLHAASLVTEAKHGRPIDELSPESCPEHLFCERALDLKMIELPLDLAGRIASGKLGKDPETVKTALRRGFMRIYKPSGKSKLSRVICHGDTWPNNYLFNQSRQPPGCVLVDFQLSRYAPRTYDVAQLMYLGASRETRKREEAQAIQAYHQELCACLKANKPELERPSLDDIKNEYEDVRLSAMYAYVVYHPLLGMSAKYRENCDLDEFFLRIMFRQNNDELMDIYESDEEYLSGMLEHVKELLEYCDSCRITKETDDDDDK